MVGEALGNIIATIIAAHIAAISAQLGWACMSAIDPMPAPLSR
jgi:hypothetical protein